MASDRLIRPIVPQIQPTPLFQVKALVPPSSSGASAILDHRGSTENILEALDYSNTLRLRYPALMYNLVDVQAQFAGSVVGHSIGDEGMARWIPMDIIRNKVL